MSPIDDELRSALHGRASLLAPSPDPLAGIERRAKQIRRNRVGAAVAASALAVSAIAVAVPALQSAVSPGPDRPAPFATGGPTDEPTVTPMRYDLDPTNPWAYRGADLDKLGPGSLDTIERELGVKHGTNDVSLTPLFGQVYEPSQQFELVFVASVAGERRWGVAQSPTDAGPEFVWDAELREGEDVLAAALPGDEGARLLVVAAPEALSPEYGPNDASEYVPMAELAPGVATIALDGDPATDLYRVSWPGAESDLVTVERPAPDLPASQQPSGDPETALDPQNPWQVRGDPSLVTGGQLDALAQEWATRHDVNGSEVELQPLYVQRNAADAGIEVVYLIRSAGGPWSWGVSSLGEGGWWWYADNLLEDPAAALAAALPGTDGKERLLIVAAPSTGGAVYSTDGRDFEPMSDLAPGVFVTDVTPGLQNDQWKVLDGDGDVDRPVDEGVAPDFQNAG